MHNLTKALFTSAGLVIAAMPISLLPWTSPAPLLCIFALIAVGFVAIYNVNS